MPFLGGDDKYSGVAILGGVLTPVSGQWRHDYSVGTVLARGSKDSPARASYWMPVPGDAIVFAVTIPKTVVPAELAADYVAFLLSAEGKAILRKHHVAVVDQPWTFDSEGVPAALSAYIVKRDRH